MNRYSSHFTKFNQEFLALDGYSWFLTSSNQNLWRIKLSLQWFYYHNLGCVCVYDGSHFHTLIVVSFTMCWSPESSFCLYFQWVQHLSIDYVLISNDLALRVLRGLYLQCFCCHSLDFHRIYNDFASIVTIFNCIYNDFAIRVLIVLAFTIILLAESWFCLHLQWFCYQSMDSNCIYNDFAISVLTFIWIYNDFTCRVLVLLVFTMILLSEYWFCLYL